MDLSDEILIEKSYIEISKYRTRVMKTLIDDVKIPSQIAADADISQKHISGTLRQLREHELVECINPEVKRGRLYRLTPKGRDVAQSIKQ